MTGYTPSFSPDQIKYLRDLSNVAREQAMRQESEATVPPSPVQETQTDEIRGIGVPSTMLLEGPDPAYVRRLEGRIRDAFSDDHEVMEKMGGSQTVAAEAAGQLATSHGTKRMPTLHKVFQPSSRPSSGTVVPSRSRTMRTPHAGTLPVTRNMQPEVTRHRRTSRVSRQVTALLRSIRHISGKSR